MLQNCIYYLFYVLLYMLSKYTTKYVLIVLYEVKKHHTCCRRLSTDRQLSLRPMESRLKECLQSRVLVKFAEQQSCRGDLQVALLRDWGQSRTLQQLGRHWDFKGWLALQLCG